MFLKTKKWKNIFENLTHAISLIIRQIKIIQKNYLYIKIILKKLMKKYELNKKEIILNNKKFINFLHHLHLLAFELIVIN